MSTTYNSITIRHLALISCLLSAILSTGCATSSVEPPPVEPKPEIQPQPVPRDWIPVTRYGRYTLMKLAPQAAQQNLLLQVVDVSLPATLHATVGDALHHVLLRSGYTLCEGDPDLTALYDLPLPLEHLQLGPLFLRDALLTLTGPAWDLQADDVRRRVCFVRAGAADPTAPYADIPAMDSARTFPAEDGGQP